MPGVFFSTTGLAGLAPVRVFPGADAGGSGSAPGVAAEPQRGAPERSFSQYLRDALAGVEAAQRAAAVAGDRLASGQIQDLAQVVVASEKATLSLQLLISVRNRALEAYQEIMRMPL